jgi:hypothetical protein
LVAQDGAGLCTVVHRRASPTVRVLRKGASRRRERAARRVLLRSGMNRIALLASMFVLVAACDEKPPAAPVAAAPVAAAPVAAAPAAAAPPAPADTAGPPAIRRMIPGQEGAKAAPFERGDYLVALDYRDDGAGTYGFLYHGDNQWWFVENDEVVGGPYADGGPEMTRVTAAWRDMQNRRHEAAMNVIGNMPRGCLDGCAFDVYRNGHYAGTRIEY